MRTVPYLSTIDLSKRILEIGPLDKPMLPKKLSPTIFYADINTAETLRERFARDGNVDTGKICDIDYCVKDGYAKLVEQGVERFDYVVSSHVLEHVPLLLDYFLDVAQVLKPHGLLCMSIPDHRFCFDHFRCPTSFAEAYDIHVHGIERASFRVLEHALCTSSSNNAAAFWTNADTAENISSKQFEQARQAYEKSLNGVYHDVHYSVFTPKSFIRFLYDQTRAGMNPFALVSIAPTTPGSNEFHVMLRKDSREASDPVKIAKETTLLKDALSKLNVQSGSPYI